jgi:hypothetical protein
MITRFITEVNTKFNPFSAKSRSARLFLSFLPPTARTQGMVVQTKLLPRVSTDKAALQVKFSTIAFSTSTAQLRTNLHSVRTCLHASHVCILHAEY